MTPPQVMKSTRGNNINDLLDKREAATAKERAAKAGVTADDLDYPSEIQISSGKVLCKRLRQVFTSAESCIEIPQAVTPKAGLFVVIGGVADPDAGIAYNPGDILVLPHYGGFPLPYKETQLYFVNVEQIEARFAADSKVAMEILANSKVIHSESDQ